MDTKFNQKDIQLLAKSLKSRFFTFNKNETILSDLNDKNKIAFVMSGIVYLCAENNNYDRSIINFFLEGDMLSPKMKPDEDLCVSYFLAKTPVTIVAFSREDLFSLAATGTAWRNKLSSLIELQLEQSFAYTSLIQHQKSIRERVMMFLVTQAKREGNNTIKLPIPYTDLADYLATERSALMREISKMKAEGLISGTNRTITVTLEMN